MTGNELSPGWSGRKPPMAFILGLGLIGGSWAGALSARGWKVSALERDESSLDTALKWGWIHEGFQELPDRIAADLVILALPLPALLSHIDRLNGRVGKGAIVTDVCSLKAQVCASAPRFIEQGVFFIGGHPMAGSEKSGFSAANPDLFKGYPYVLTPGENTPPQAVNALTKLIKEIGAKLVLRDPEAHDREVAMVSHLPHILAVALAESAQDLAQHRLDPLALSGRSFREMTRIVDSSPDLWKEILASNSEALLESLAIWENRLSDMKRYLQAADRESLARAFREAQNVRRQLE